MQEQPLLSLENISKTFGGVKALSDVSLTIGKGEVHAVVGENGAGKSTLMKIIAGALHPDSGGKLYFEGEHVELTGPRDASLRGVSIVYQEPMFFAELSVLENFYLGEEIKNATGSLDWEKMTEEGADALKRIGLPLDILGKAMNELSIGTQQLVLIARGIHKKAKLLILDEPTSILSHAETEVLFKTIRELKSQGVSILYISHRIAEIFQIADFISVLRDGKLVSSFTLQEATEEKMISAMSGRNISADVFRERSINYQQAIIEVKNLSTAGYYRDVSFSLHAGEVLGLYGLVGAGRSEVVRAIFGEMPADSGEIFYDGNTIHPTSARDGFSNGIVYVPEDRRRQGLFPIRSIRDNLSSGLLGKALKPLGWVDTGAERNFVKQQMEAIEIKSSGMEAPVSSLSGGNQQKVIFGRGLLHQPRVLILDEPTRGIDVGTKTQIHHMVMDLAEKGLAVLLVSSDLPEVLALADNFLVMHEGRVMGYVPRKDASEDLILRLALGLEDNGQPGNGKEK